MKVFLTGATGFVGGELLEQLIKEGIAVRCLVRPGSEAGLPTMPGVEIHMGDATRPESLLGSLSGCQAVINLIGIIREFPGKGITFQKLHVEATGNLVAAAQEQGVERFLQMSANGTRADAVTAYHKTKWRAEEIVRDSALDWTIFRPSLIYGPDDQFVNMLVELINKLPVMPVMGNGRYRMQPVSVEQVARSYVAALSRPDSIGQIFHCCGPQPHSYDEIIDMIGKALGKSEVRKLHHPLLLMRPVIRLLEGIPLFPISSGQLQMLLEENCCDPDHWRDFFGIEAQPFMEGIAAYLNQ